MPPQTGDGRHPWMPRFRSNRHHPSAVYCFICGLFVGILPDLEAHDAQATGRRRPRGASISAATSSSATRTIPIETSRSSRAAATAKARRASRSPWRRRPPPASGARSSSTRTSATPRSPANSAWSDAPDCARRSVPRTRPGRRTPRGTRISTRCRSARRAASIPRISRTPASPSSSRRCARGST